MFLFMQTPGPIVPSHPTMTRCQMESHDDSHNKIVCFFSMFVRNCFDEDEDEAQYEHKWGGSPPGRGKKIE